MLRTTVSGKDLIVWVDGHDETPKTFVMHTPMAVADLEQHFGRKALVYLANKNLQRMPKMSESDNDAQNSCGRKGSDCLAGWA
jgi:hypothetical protein